MITKNPKLNLDVDSPEKVIDVLNAAIAAYYESSNVLTASWQNCAAGLPWITIAKIFEQTVKALENSKNLKPFLKR